MCVIGVQYRMSKPFWTTGCSNAHIHPDPHPRSRAWCFWIWHWVLLSFCLILVSISGRLYQTFYAKIDSWVFYLGLRTAFIMLGWMGCTLPEAHLLCSQHSVKHTILQGQPRLSWLLSPTKLGSLKFHIVYIHIEIKYIKYIYIYYVQWNWTIQTYACIYDTWTNNYTSNETRLICNKSRSINRFRVFGVSKSSRFNFNVLPRCPQTKIRCLGCCWCFRAKKFVPNFHTQTNNIEASWSHVE